MSGDDVRRKPQVFDPDNPKVKPTPAPDERSGKPPELGEKPIDQTGSEDKADSNSEQMPGYDETSAKNDDNGLDESSSTSGVSLAVAFEDGIRWGALLFSAALSLATLAAGVWFARFVSVAVGRDDWLGVVAKGLALCIGLAVAALILREVIGFFRLARLSRIRRDGEEAVASQDVAIEKRSVDGLKRLFAGRSNAKWAIDRFREQERHQKAPGALLELADTVLLREPDKQARRIVFESSRRVGVVTAVVPIAALVILFVLFETVRMVRRLAATYGGRPGFFGGLRLLWRVISHVAATGAVALTDDLFGQFLGQDVVRRLSRRLGEGAFNGALTARLGVAAIEVCRPLPYIKAKPLRARHVIRELFPELRPAAIMRSVIGRSDPGKKSDPGKNL